jgi:hypothetical protein
MQRSAGFSLRGGASAVAAGITTTSAALPAPTVVGGYAETAGAVSDGTVLPIGRTRMVLGAATTVYLVC